MPPKAPRFGWFCGIWRLPNRSLFGAEACGAGLLLRNPVFGAGSLRNPVFGVGLLPRNPVLGGCSLRNPVFGVGLLPRNPVLGGCSLRNPAFGAGLFRNPAFGVGSLRNSPRYPPVGAGRGAMLFCTGPRYWFVSVRLG